MHQVIRAIAPIHIAQCGNRIQPSAGKVSAIRDRTNAIQTVTNKTMMLMSDSQNIMKNAFEGAFDRIVSEIVDL